MTYEDINIKYSDLLLSKYQFNGSFPHDDLRQEKNIKLTDEEKKLYTDKGMEWFATLTGFMIHNGYFLDDGQRYVLSERGNLAKELHGHKNYQEHRRREINLLKHQDRINKWLVATALLAILSPMIMEIGNQRKWWFQENQESPVFQIQNHVDVHIDSNTMNSIKHNNIPKK